MNLFDGDDETVIFAIKYFNELSENDKIRIVADLNPLTFQPKQHFVSLLPLLSKVQQSLSKYDGVTIGNKLMELGLEETYAHLIVTNMKKHAPTLEYQLNQLNVMEEDVFSKLEKITNSIWIDHENPNTVTEKYNINQDQLHSIIDITSNTIMALLRGDKNEKEIVQDFIKNGLSKNRTELLLKVIQTHKEVWYPTLMFSNTQDVFFKIQEIEKQNKQMLRIMNDIVSLLRTKNE